MIPGGYDWADDMLKVMEDRQLFGRFYYRFPDGEAGTDVFDRMAAFITYLFRTMGRVEDRLNADNYLDEGAAADDPAPVQNYVLVTHGLLMRIFCMCYFRWTVSEFEQVCVCARARRPSRSDL